MTAAKHPRTPCSFCGSVHQMWSPIEVEVRGGVPARVCSNTCGENLRYRERALDALVREAQARGEYDR